jgi:hypothetical protein
MPILLPRCFLEMRTIAIHSVLVNDAAPEIL